MSQSITVPVALASANYPQTTNNRTCEELIGEIAEYVGGESSTPAKNRAKSALKSSVRAHNTWAWICNRQTEDVTLLDNISEYELNFTIRNPLRATLKDTNGIEIGAIEWRHYRSFITENAARTGTSQIPTSYTLQNRHLNGLLRLQPRIGSGGFSYPTLKVEYHSRILPPATGQVINVPEEIEESIYQLAVALAVERFRSFQEGVGARLVAQNLRLDLEAEYRDYPDRERRL